MSAEAGMDSSHMIGLKCGFVMQIELKRRRNMTITKEKVTTPEGTVLNAKIDGRIDASNAEELLDSISGDLKRVKVLNLDFQNVDYISSVGIRSLLLLFKQLRRQDGRMEIININEQVREILKLIGLMEFIKHDN